MQGSKTIAYLRVSTADQDLEKDKDAILRLANDKNLGRVDFVQEKVSGKISWKQRKICNIVAELAKGDSLIVSELSRLGRSMLEIMEILSVLKDKEVQVYAVKGNWSLSGSIESKIIGMVFAIAAEIERELISQRTKEALRIRKDQGIKLGRPKGTGKSKLDQFKDEIIALLENGSTKAFVAHKYSTTPANLYNWLKRNDCELMHH
jgi:DNA invertase Pin-like site-specific DNA recombinase